MVTLSIYSIHSVLLHYENGYWFLCRNKNAFFSKFILIRGRFAHRYSAYQTLETEHSSDIIKI